MFFKKFLKKKELKKNSNVLPSLPSQDTQEVKKKQEIDQKSFKFFPMNKGGDDHKLIIATIVNGYKSVEENELSVVEGEYVVVEKVEEELGWILCRKVSDFKLVGYLPFDCFEMGKCVSLLFVGEVIEEVMYRHKVGEIVFISRINRSEDKAEYCGAPRKYPFSGSDIELKKVKKIELGKYEEVKKKLEKRLQLVDCVKKLPFRLIVELISEYFIVEDFGILTSYYGKFLSDKSQKVFCIHKAVRISWNDAVKEESLRKLPVRHISHVEFYFKSSGGFLCSHELRNRSTIQKTIANSFWKNCVSLQGIGEFLVKDDGLKSREDVIDFLNKDIVRIRSLRTHYLSKKMVSAISSFHKLESISIYSQPSLSKVKKDDENSEFLLNHIRKLKFNGAPKVTLPMKIRLISNKGYHLRELEISRSIIERTRIDSIVEITCLKLLTLSNCYFLEGCDFYRIFNIKSLENLFFVNDKIDKEGKAFVPQTEIEKLEKIDFKENCKLHHLSISNVRLPRSVAGQILRIKGMYVLSLNYCEISKYFCNSMKNNIWKEKIVYVNLREKLGDEEIKQLREEFTGKFKNIKFGIY